jgi:hypothetical protein
MSRGDLSELITGVLNMDSRKIPTQAPRGEADALAIVGMLSVGVLVALIAVVMAARFLADLPPMLAAGIVFSLFVFAAVCATAWLKTDVQPRRSHPPQLNFRPRRPQRAR